MIAPDAGTSWSEWAVRQRQPGGTAIAWVWAPDARTADEVAGRGGGWHTPGEDRTVNPCAEHQQLADGTEFSAIVPDEARCRATRAGRLAASQANLDPDT